MSKKYFLLLALLLLNACARSVRVEVNALASPESAAGAGTLAEKHCIVLPAAGETSPDDLRFREFAAQAARDWKNTAADRLHARKTRTWPCFSTTVSASLC